MKINNPYRVDRTYDLSKSDYKRVDFLWNQEYPVQLQDRFALLLKDLQFCQHYVIHEKDLLIGWAVLFEKDKEKRFSILVDSGYQGLGIGRALIRALQADHVDFFGWVIDHNRALKKDGTPYKSPLPFYEKLDFTILQHERIDNDLLSAVKIHFKAQLV